MKRAAVLVLCLAGCGQPHVVEVHECDLGPYLCTSQSTANTVSTADHMDDPKLLDAAIAAGRIVPIEPGTKVTVIDERPDYAVEVRLSNGKTGWILRECVRELK